jgi:hypothetical protein
MKRALFLLTLAAATVTVTSLRAVRQRRATQVARGNAAGACANHHRTMRWSAYTAADFS